MEIETPSPSSPTSPAEEINLDLTESIEDASYEESSRKKEKRKSKKAKKKESAKKKADNKEKDKENKEEKEDKKKAQQPQQPQQQPQPQPTIQPLTPLPQPTAPATKASTIKKDVEFSLLPVNIANLSIGDVNIKFRNEMTLSGDEIGFTVEVGGIGSSEAVETLEKEVANAKKELKAWEEKLQQVKMRNGVF